MIKKTTGINFGLLPLGVLIIVVNIIVMYLLDTNVSKMVRLFSGVLLVGFLLYKGGYKNNTLSIAIVALLVRDIAILFNHITFYKTLSLTCTVLVYLVIGLFALKRLRKVQWSKAIIGLGLFMIALNIFNIFYFYDGVLPDFYDETQLILLFSQLTLLVFMGFFTFLYNEAFDGKQSLHLLFCVMAFLFSDLSGLACGILDYEPALYADRALYFVATCFLIDYIINFQPTADSLGELNK